jgi:hypothetical protein
MLWWGAVGFVEYMCVCKYIWLRFDWPP